MGDFVQCRGAATGVKPAPFHLRSPGLLNDLVERRWIAIGDLPDRLKRRRIDHVDGVSAVHARIVVAGKNLPGKSVEISQFST